MVIEANTTFMVKTCPSHGTYKTVLWRGGIPMEQWARDKVRATIDNPKTKVERGCPYDCGLCKEHRQHTCTALIEVTQNCNLNCTFCFADSTVGHLLEPTLEEIKYQYESVMKASGKCNIQLSGGEPTVRTDLPEIIKMGKDMEFGLVQVNTNGIRLADEGYVALLAQAGLTSIFLQFDGVDDTIYTKLRNKAILYEKIKAIENCGKHGIGVVLVPTIVPGINNHQIGDIVRFGIEYAPTVRGVHFQPVSYFGRVKEVPKDEQRITLPEVMTALCQQTQGMIPMDSLKPPGCENAMCSFHGNYSIMDGSLVPITKRNICCCSSTKESDDLAGLPIELAEEGANKAKAFVARNWSGVEYQGTVSSDWDDILKGLKQHAFSISAMAFQDVWNVDLERVKDCCIHVVTNDGRLIPFCIYNLTDTNGRSLYRKKNH